MPLLRFGRTRPPVSPISSRESRARAAFDQVYRELAPHARVFARRYLKDSPWADDLVQDAFAALWTSCYQGQEPPAGTVDDLLYKILRRRIVSWIRRRKIGVSADEVEVTDIAAHLTGQTDTTHVAEGSLLAGRLTYLIGALPVHLRRAHELRMAGEEYPFIAAELQTSEATARWNVYEARRRLRKQLVSDGYLPSAELERSLGTREGEP